MGCIVSNQLVPVESGILNAERRVKPFRIRRWVPPGAVWFGLNQARNLCDHEK
jgi:hypothetical protein